MGSKWNKFSRSWAVGAAAIALLVVTVALGAALGARTRAQFREVEASWRDYAAGAERKGVWVSEIRARLGFGGVVDHFDAFLLGGGEADLRAGRADLDALRETLADFRAAARPEERAALEVIAEAARAYAERLDAARRAAREGWSVARRRELGRIGGAVVAEALDRLEASWRAERLDSSARILRAVTEGQTLIWIGFLSIFALILAAGVVGAMLALLLRDMRAAMAQLAEELAERGRLEQSEGRLAAAVEQSPATIVITDIEARILYANRRFEEITGWRRDEIAGRTPRFLQSGDSPPEVYAEIRARLAAGQSWRGVFRNRRKDGGSYWAETTILPLLDADGAPRSFIGIAEDVTERRLAREQVVRAQKLEAVGLLAGGVAHDFNNILTTIIGSAHLARLDAPARSNLAGEIEQIEIAARRAQALVRELLTFARRKPGRPQPVDLAKLCGEVARLMRASTPTSVRIEAPDPGASTIALSDPTHVHQILMNLCRNAVEAIGGGRGAIVMGARTLAAAETGELPARPGGWVELTVADDGPGMTAETRRRLFDPFFTTKPLGKGSGLGLSVVAGLVEEMGGAITVDSAPDEGARFTLHLPGASAAAAVEEADETPPPRGRERVLLVDDATDVVGTFRRGLVRLGYQVEAFASSAVALERFRRDPRRFDALVTDIVMPELDGVELASAARALRPDLPVVFCTGYAPARTEIPGPPPAMVAKPADPFALASKLREVLDTCKSKDHQ